MAAAKAWSPKKSHRRRREAFISRGDNETKRIERWSHEDFVMGKFNRRLCAFLKRLRALPQEWRQARMRRLRQKVLAEGESERIDRIRHPWKYRGK